MIEEGHFAMALMLFCYVFGKDVSKSASTFKMMCIRLVKLQPCF